MSGGPRMQLKTGPSACSSRFRLGYSAVGYSPTRIFWILPGFAGGSPLGRASTCSMPSITSPHTVYWRSRNVASSKQMKNWLFALFGLAERAIEQTPRTWGSLLNSRSEEHTYELQSLMRISYAVFCL